MKRKLYALCLGLGLLFAAFTTVQQAHATLGESVYAVEQDREAIPVVRRVVTAGNGFTVHETDYDSTVVREYVSSSGVVFGIAWNGLIHADLEQFLGSYASEYQNALKQSPRKPGQRRIHLKTDRIVVEKWGHMRNLQGRAYAPALMPPGVSVNEIR